VVFVLLLLVVLRHALLRGGLCSLCADAARARASNSRAG
jgi:hypothetical protein